MDAIMREKMKKIQYCTAFIVSEDGLPRSELQTLPVKLPVAYCQTINFPMMVPVSAPYD